MLYSHFSEFQNSNDLSVFLDLDQTVTQLMDVHLGCSFIDQFDKLEPAHIHATKTFSSGEHPWTCITIKRETPLSNQSI
jgi:hypothetical protein